MAHRPRPGPGVPGWLVLVWQLAKLVFGKLVSLLFANSLEGRRKLGLASGDERLRASMGVLERIVRRKLNKYVGHTVLSFS